MGVEAIAAIITGIIGILTGVLGGQKWNKYKKTVDKVVDKINMGNNAMQDDTVTKEEIENILGEVKTVNKKKK